MKIAINNLNLIDQTVQLYNNIFKDTNYFNTGLKEEWLKDINSSAKLFTAEEEFDGKTKVVGFAFCDNIEDTFIIFYAGVIPEFRNRGIWKSIFSEIKKYAKNAGFKEIGVENSEEMFPLMTQFLIKNNFKELDRIKVQDKFDSVRYLLKI